MERRLGRGLGSLLGQTPPTDGAAEPEEPSGTASTDAAHAPASTTGTPAAEVAAVMLDVTAIRRNPDQPRVTFERAALEELQDSIRRHGVLQPICVRRKDEGYEIVSGERRWRAARSAGLTRIPAVVRESLSDDVTLELAIVENVQRQDLDPLEKARGYQSLMDRVGLTQEQVADRVGVSRTAVTNHLRLLDLPGDAQEAISGGLISMGHAKALLGLKGKKDVLNALAQVVRQDLSVRATESLVKTKGDPSEAAASSRAEPPAWVGEMESRLREALGVKVSLKNGRGYKGTLQLDYSNREELERICDLLAPKGRLE